MDNAGNPSGTESPTGSDSLSALNPSRKRERGTEGDGDAPDLPTKRNNRPTLTYTKPGKTTLDTVMSKLTDISADMANQRALLQDLPVIRATVDTVSTEVHTLKAATEQLMTTTNLLLNRTQDLATENAELKRTVTALESRVDQLALAGNANALSNQRAQTCPLNEFSISGLTLGQVGEPSLLQLAAAVAGALKVNISLEEFTSARLLRKTPPVPEPGHAAPTEQQSVAVRTTFAVVCSSQSIVRRLLGAKRSFGALKYSQLDKNILTNTDLAAGQPGDPLIHVNELLPSNVLKLLNDAKTQLKAAGFKYIWSRNLTVFAKFTSDSLVQIVNTPADIPRIALLYSQERPNQGQQQQQ